LQEDIISTPDKNRLHRIRAGFADWTQIFGDANMTAALLDRLTHRAHIIKCLWDSYRL